MIQFENIIPVGVIVRIMKGGVVEYDGESSEMTVENDEVKPQTIVENIIKGWSKFL